MKLKQLPSDFIVEELPSLVFSQEKQAKQIFLLEKQEIDTFGAIRLLSRKTGVPLREIGYAGLKDKHAIARQYVSFPAHCDVQEIKTRELHLRCIGYYPKKIKIGDLKGNRFQITVRDLSMNEMESIRERTPYLPLYGVPNYFDSQRFGSVFDNTFIVKYIMKKEYEHAVKLFLTRYLKSEPKQIKDEKRR